MGGARPGVSCSAIQHDASISDVLMFPAEVDSQPPIDRAWAAEPRGSPGPRGSPPAGGGFATRPRLSPNGGPVFGSRERIYWALLGAATEAAPHLRRREPIRNGLPMQAGHRSNPYRRSGRGWRQRLSWRASGSGRSGLLGGAQLARRSRPRNAWAPEAGIDIAFPRSGLTRRIVGGGHAREFDLLPPCSTRSHSSSHQFVSGPAILRRLGLPGGNAGSWDSGRDRLACLPMGAEPSGGKRLRATFIVSAVKDP